jgi:hypothetical protein
MGSSAVSPCARLIGCAAAAAAISSQPGTEGGKMVNRSGCALIFAASSLAKVFVARARARLRPSWANSASLLFFSCVRKKSDTTALSAAVWTFLFSNTLANAPQYKAGLLGYPQPLMSFSVVRATNFSSSDPAPAGYGGGRALVPGETIPLRVSNNPNDRYYFVAICTLPYYDGNAEIVMYVLQLRATVDTGPIQTTPSLHWANFVGQTYHSGNSNDGNFTDDAGDSGWFGTSKTQSVDGSGWVVNQTVVHIGTKWGQGYAPHLTKGWTVRYMGGP